MVIRYFDAHGRNRSRSFRLLLAAGTTLPTAIALRLSRLMSRRLAGASVVFGRGSRVTGEGTVEASGDITLGRDVRISAAAGAIVRMGHGTAIGDGARIVASSGVLHLDRGSVVEPGARVGASGHDI